MVVELASGPTDPAVGCKERDRLRVETRPGRRLTLEARRDDDKVGTIARIRSEGRPDVLHAFRPHSSDWTDIELGDSGGDDPRWPSSNPHGFTTAAVNVEPIWISST